MTQAELQALLKADFLSLDGLTSFTFTDTKSSPSSETVDNARITFPVVKGFGDPLIKGYLVESVTLTFPVDEITATPREADTVTIGGVVYEVTKVENRSANTRWWIQAERAYLDTDVTVTVDVERATLSLDAASATVKSWSAVYSSQAAAIQEWDNTADMIERLGVRADKTAIQFYFPASLDIQPTDRIKYNSRYYRITYQGSLSRVARLQYQRAELYN